MLKPIVLSFFAVLLALDSRAGETIAADKAYRSAQSGDLVLVDVRTEAEWRATGLPAGSLGIPLQDDDFVQQVLVAVKGDRTQPVAVICRTGGRSEHAMNRLEAAGFSQVYNVAEGLFGRPGAGPGWRARALPLGSPGRPNRGSE